MYLLAACFCSFGYVFIALAQPNDKIHLSDDIALRDMLFELKSLVWRQNERILELERQNGKQSEEINKLRTMMQAQDVKLCQSLNRCENNQGMIKTLTRTKPKRPPSEQPFTYEDPTVFRTGRCKLQRFSLSTVLQLMHHIVFFDSLSAMHDFLLAHKLLK